MLKLCHVIKILNIFFLFSTLVFNSFFHTFQNKKKIAESKILKAPNKRRNLRTNLYEFLVYFYFYSHFLHLNFFSSQHHDTFIAFCNLHIIHILSSLMAIPFTYFFYEWRCVWSVHDATSTTFIPHNIFFLLHSYINNNFLRSLRKILLYLTFVHAKS